MTKEELVTLMEVVAQDAKESLMFNGFLQPVFLVKNGEKIDKLPLEYTSDEEKDDVAVALSLYVKMVKAECVIQVSEAWLTLMQISGPMPEAPSNGEMRKEALIVSGAIPAGETVLAFTYTRNGKEINIEDDLPKGDFVPRQSRFFWLLWSEKVDGLLRQRWQC